MAAAEHDDGSAPWRWHCTEAAELWYVRALESNSGPRTEYISTTDHGTSRDPGADCDVTFNQLVFACTLPLLPFSCGDREPTSAPSNTCLVYGGGSPLGQARTIRVAELVGAVLAWGKRCSAESETCRRLYFRKAGGYREKLSSGEKLLSGEAVVREKLSSGGNCLVTREAVSSLEHRASGHSCGRAAGIEDAGQGGSANAPPDPGNGDKSHHPAVA